MRRRCAALGWVAAAALMALAAAPAGAQQKQQPNKQPQQQAAQAAGGGSYAQRYAAQCAACHGANGRSEMAGTPVLAGQHSFYAVTQLFLFREGRRSNEAMTAVAKTLKDDDLRGFSDYIATLPPVPAPAPATPPDAARMAKGKALAQENKCVFCHGADLSGGQQVPRLAQQREDYLLASLREFKSGKRLGYTPAMLDALTRLSPEDIDTLAYYLARFPSSTSK
ncbi:MAG TPA: c-type cytochrome [Variovorax sp.]|nr:c-type cytochrome [Variovorax sp.]